MEGERELNSDLEDVKREVAAANRVLANLGLAVGVTAALGHASMRVPSEPNHFFVKGREYEFDALAVMEPDDMVMCDTEGFLIAGRPVRRACPPALHHPHEHPHGLAKTDVPGRRGARARYAADLPSRQNYSERRGRHGGRKSVG